ncbi:MAG: elongation factor P [Deltaproteobacteria bacterium]|nr:elongation factor P [Deltaproteobacteria bacterium]
MINATQIRSGMILRIENVLYRVLKVQHITPGKGNAQIQTDIRNLKTGIKHNMRFRSVEAVDEVELEASNINFLYQEGDTFHFMDPNSYEQFELSKSFLEDALPYLKPEIQIMILSFEGAYVSYTLPKRVNLTVVECDPPSKGMAGALKTAKVENEAEFKVPLFIKPGDVVAIDTETGEYLEKG